MRDPVDELAHDHSELNRRVLALGALLGTGMLPPQDADARGALLHALGELRDQLFLHFAREEEGLFPFVADAIPALADEVATLAVAHDAICGALARMLHLASIDADLATITTLYARFEDTYAAHAKNESTLLLSIRGRLDAEQRARLASLVDGL